MAFALGLAANLRIVVYGAALLLEVGGLLLACVHLAPRPDPNASQQDDHQPTQGAVEFDLGVDREGHLPRVLAQTAPRASAAIDSFLPTIGNRNCCPPHQLGDLLKYYGRAA